jgi:hypothetical protein
MHRIGRTLAGLVVLVTLLSGTTASANWLSGGSGTGSASTGTMQTVTVDALVGGDDPASVLVPGGPAAEVILRVTNPNASAVQVYEVVGNGSITADPAHSACTTTGVTFTAPSSPISPTVTVPAYSTVVVRLPGAASMSTASLSVCQGATFRIPVSVTARQ